MRVVLLSLTILALLSASVLAQQKTAPGYLVAEVEVLDRDSAREFRAKATPLVKAYGGEFISRGGKISPLAGPAPKAIVIVRFDTVEKAEAYYNSSEYKALIPLRDRAMKYKSYIIEGGDHPQ